MDSTDTYSPCIVDIKVEKESLQASESNEAVESLKNESLLVVSFSAVHLFRL